MEFKRLSDVEVVAEPTESANVLIEENGVIKKAPKTAVGGGDKWDVVIEWYDTDDDNHLTLISGDYQTVYNKIMDGEVPKIMIKTCTQYGSIAYNTVMAVNVGVLPGDPSYIVIPRPETIMVSSTGIYLRWGSDNTFVEI